MGNRAPPSRGPGCSPPAHSLQPFPHMRISKREARAFQDAMRDILAEDGIFSLADEKELGTTYHFDGVRWWRQSAPRETRRPSAAISATSSSSLPRIERLRS